MNDPPGAALRAATPRGGERLGTARRQSCAPTLAAAPLRCPPRGRNDRLGTARRRSSHLAHLDDALLAPRDRCRFGDLQRRQTVVDRRADRLAVADRIDEMRHLLGIGDAVALEEEVLA